MTKRSARKTGHKAKKKVAKRRFYSITARKGTTKGSSADTKDTTSTGPKKT